jgi:formate C-acetyltransferase
MLCLEAEEQIGLPQPEFGIRLWEGTPDSYLKKAAEVIRIGRGKPKFLSDRKALQLAAKAFPDLTVEDWREYVVTGCTELTLPHIAQSHSWEGIAISTKFLELALNNGRCALCDKQVGPATGDPRSFESMSAVRQAFRCQLSYAMKCMAKGIKLIKEAQAQRMTAPLGSALLEGPLEKAVDMAAGGALYTNYGLYLAGVADTSDSLAVIEKLIYQDKKATWEQLLEAMRANWSGYEDLRQLCINGVPKYGNDNDYADGWAAWVMDAWYDSVDWINSQKEFLPYYGGEYVGSTIIGQNNVTFGYSVSAMPNGRAYPKPLADCISPFKGMDTNGPTAVIMSVSKLPTHRFAMGGVLNLRLSPQLIATDRDIETFASFLRSLEELGIYHTQFNVVSSDYLRKAMEAPEEYRDLLVRVASYCAYFYELTDEQKLDIISRTEHSGW